MYVCYSHPIWFTWAGSYIFQLEPLCGFYHGQFTYCLVNPEPQTYVCLDLASIWPGHIKKPDLGAVV